jgi:hypothetical protein
VKAKAAFVDYRASHARAHADTLDPAQDMLFAEAPPIVLSTEDLPKLRKQIAIVHQATAHGFAALGLPAKLRWIVCVIIGAAAAAESEAAQEGRTIFAENVAKFRASYATLAGLMYHNGDGRTFEAKKKEIARLLKTLIKWQVGKQKTLCTIRPGGKTTSTRGDVYHDTEFELSFLNAIARALLHDPNPERVRSVVCAEVSAMYKLPPFDSRWQVKKPTPEEMQERDHKAALHKALKAALAESDFGGDPIAYLKALAKAAEDAATRALVKEPEIRQRVPHYTSAEVRDHAIREAISEVLTSGQDNIQDEASVENTLVESIGGVTDASHPPAPEKAAGSAPDQPQPGTEIAPNTKAYKALNPAEAAAPVSEPTPADEAIWQEYELRMRAHRTTYAG